MAREMTPQERAAASFCINDRVRVKGTRYVRTIESFMLDVKGGVRLNKPVNGLYCWNVLDLKALTRLAQEG